jgi:hypothetical protein
MMRLQSEDYALMLIVFVIVELAVLLIYSIYKYMTTRGDN